MTTAQKSNQNIEFIKKHPVMYGKIQEHLQKELEAIREAGLYKNERVIVSPQDAVIQLSTGQEVLNFCANNYLGLSNHPALIRAATEALESHGYGMSSVRFICGTTDLHKSLEKKNSRIFWYRRYHPVCCLL
jgi:glycine C-acetyltransferase